MTRTPQAARDWAAGLKERADRWCTLPGSTATEATMRAMVADLAAEVARLADQVERVEAERDEARLDEGDALAAADIEARRADQMQAERDEARVEVGRHRAALDAVESLTWTWIPDDSERLHLMRAGTITITVPTTMLREHFAAALTPPEGRP